jgi:hypothetical protein
MRRGSISTAGGGETTGAGEGEGASSLALTRGLYGIVGRARCDRGPGIGPILPIRTLPWPPNELHNGSMRGRGDDSPIL